MYRYSLNRGYLVNFGFHEPG